MRLMSYAAGRWVEGTGRPTVLASAITGEPVAEIDSTGLDFAAMLHHARSVGGPALRKLTFHQRALLLKALAGHLMERKEEFYALSKPTGATRTDAWIDVEGGIGTLFAYASKGRRELPNATFHLDGGPEIALQAAARFVGQHICVPLEGAAVHINAFNFPGWGMLEKLAPTLLAGMPAIVKPASQTAYVAELMVRRIVESGILPEGCAAADLRRHRRPVRAPDRPGRRHLHRLGLAPAAACARIRRVIEHSVRFTMEADSLNFSLLGPDAAPGTPGVRPLRQGGRARDDGQGRAEMHRHPPRLRPARPASRRSPRRCGTAWPGPSSATPPTRRVRMGAARQPAPSARRCARACGSWPRSPRSSPAAWTGSRSSAPTRSRAPSSRPILLRCDEPHCATPASTRSKPSARSAR